MTILIVEDEQLIAHHLAQQLRKYGYHVAGLAQSGEEALQQIAALQPDLVLMDIDLGGEMDGIETADRVRLDFSIPVIFLTAHDTPEYLDRAKKAQPFGYLVKPIRHIDLVSTLEMAAYKHQIDRKLKQREAWLTTTLNCAGDGVIVTDHDARIEFINDVAKRMLGLERPGFQNLPVHGVNFSDLVHLKNRFTGVPAGDLVLLAILQGGTMGIGADLVLDTDGRPIDIEGEISLSEADGVIAGTVFTFRDVTIRKHQEEHRAARSRQQGLRPPGLRHVGGIAKPARRLAEPRIGRCRNRPKPGNIPYDGRTRWPLWQSIRRSRGPSISTTYCGNRSPATAMGRVQPSKPPALCTRSFPKSVLTPGQLQEAVARLLQHGRDAMPGGGTIHITTAPYAFERHSRTEQAENYVRLTIDFSGPVPQNHRSRAAVRALFRPRFRP